MKKAQQKNKNDILDVSLASFFKPIETSDDTKILKMLFVPYAALKLKSDKYTNFKYPTDGEPPIHTFNDWGLYIEEQYYQDLLKWRKSFK